MTLSDELGITPPVIILGVHRSGTSLLTRMLEQVGLYVGKDLQGDHESLIMIQVNNNYLNQKKASWDKPAYPTDADVAENRVRKLLQKNVDAIRDAFGDMTGAWGFKDPRTVVTLPLWREVFPTAKIVYITRSPADIAKSLTTRHQQLIKRGVFPAEGNFKKGNIAFTQRCATFDGSMEFALEQINYIDTLKSEGTLAGYLEMSYESLLRDPMFQLSRMCEYLNLRPEKAQVLEAAKLPRNQSELDPEMLFERYFER